MKKRLKNLVVMPAPEHPSPTPMRHGRVYAYTLFTFLYACHCRPSRHGALVTCSSCWAFDGGE
eukprot:3938779-Amphidinium_carterae.1